MTIPSLSHNRTLFVVAKAKVMQSGEKTMQETSRSKYRLELMVSLFLIRYPTMCLYQSRRRPMEASV